MKKLLSLTLIILALATPKLARAQHLQVMVETSAFARQILTNDTAAQWAALILLGTNYNFANFAVLNGTNQYAGINSFTNLGNAFVGNGSGLTNLNAANLTNTVPLASLPAAVVTNNATGLTLSGTFSGNGAGLTNVGTNAIGLGAMAFQPTNAPVFWSGTNFGALSIRQTSGDFTSGANDQHFGMLNGLDLWYNWGHSVEPELQFGIGGSVSWTIGQDSQAKATGHFGGSGAYHSLWFMQYDDLGLTNNPGHSTPLGYALHLNSGAAQNFILGGWLAEQVDSSTQAYRLNWHDYFGKPTGFNQPDFMNSDHIAGGLGSNTIFWGGGEFTNEVTRGNSTLSPVTTQVIDFAYNAKDYLTLNAVTALALVTSNLSFTNMTVSKTIYIHASFLDVPLTLPANWLTMTNAAQTANTVPTNAPASNDLVIQLTANCGVTTNIYAAYSYVYNPTANDTNVSAFLTASGITGGTNTAYLNNFVMSAKAKGYWQNLLAFHPHMGGTSNSCSWNLVATNKYRIAWTGSSSTNFTALGIYGDGSTFYGDTRLNPGTELTSLNSSAMFVSVRGPALPVDGGYFFGVIGSGAPANRWGVRRNTGFFSAAGFNYNALDTALQATNASGFAGITGVNRTAATTQVLYANGALFGGSSASGAVVNLPDLNVYICARNSQGTADSFSNANLTGDCVAQNMTAQNVSDLITDWNVLNTSLGR